ncbi:MAG: hypothetical protein MUD08_06225 [Cytophagales bacterium]|nr:hypothetical protein [Cytophagales bacterium]
MPKTQNFVSTARLVMDGLGFSVFTTSVLDKFHPKHYRTPCQSPFSVYRLDMKAHKINGATLGDDREIVTATLSDSNEVLLLTTEAEVISYNFHEQQEKHLFSTKTSFQHRDEGFDTTAHSSIYTMDDIVVVVNDYKRHGFVHYPGQYHTLHLWRGEYHADISRYPIALFKNDRNVPHLIYGQDWNHVQIMNLDTRQVLTAAKSLIEENAEEKHIEFYKNHEETNKHPWPRPYDYFFGELLVSPNQKRFLSAGWGWGSADVYNVYDIAHFINSNRIADIRLGAWEHEGRAVCWVDDETVAIAYNPSAEGDEGATADSPCEIHFHRIQGNESTIEKKIAVAEPFATNVELRYNKHLNAFIAYSGKIGLLIISLDGQTVFQNKNLKIKGSKTEGERELLVAYEGKTIEIYSCSL